MKYLPLFHHFKAIYQFPKHINVFVKIVANAPLILIRLLNNVIISKTKVLLPQAYIDVHVDDVR